MKIETIEIHNYRVLQDVKLDNIGSMAVFLGENGAGKTTFFDVFGFMKSNVAKFLFDQHQERFNEILEKMPPDENIYGFGIAELFDPNKTNKETGK